MVLFIGDIKQKGNLFKLDMEININEYLKEQNNGYKLIHSELKKDEKGLYRMDFEDMEKKLIEKKER